MLDKEVFFNGMDELLMAFPSWRLNVEDKKVMKFWYSKFTHMDNERFTYMVNSYINGESYPPTIKGMNNHDNIPRKSKEQIRHEQMLRGIGS